LSSATQFSGLENFIDATVSRRYELNEMLPPLDYVKMQQRMHPDGKAEYREIACGFAFYAGENSPLNQAVGMGLHGPVDEAEFDTFESFYRERNSPAQIVLSPYADMSLLGFVRDRGYRLTEFNSVMVCKLAEFESRPLAPGIRLERVTPGTSQRWARVIVDCFRDIGEMPESLFEPWGLIPHGLNFLAYVDGEVAGGAGGSIYPEHKLAAIYGAATAPNFRCRGVQNALFQARLQEAKAAGCEIALVCTQPASGSQRNAERNGFRLAYTKTVLVRTW
jgi:ribosomal protein S18 acetylase RimI-like enzyme